MAVHFLSGFNGQCKIIIIVLKWQYLHMAMIVDVGQGETVSMVDIISMWQNLNWGLQSAHPSTNPASTAFLFSSVMDTVDLPVYLLFSLVWYVSLHSCAYQYNIPCLYYCILFHDEQI